MSLVVVFGVFEFNKSILLSKKNTKTFTSKILKS